MHVIFYRVRQPGVIEFVRVLNKRMETAGHIGAEVEARKKSKEF